MARGWESKSVESQLEEKERQNELRDSERLSPEERDRRERLASLTLSRARTLEQLERATNRAHREMLRRSLAALENQIEEAGRERDDGT